MSGADSVSEMTHREGCADSTMAGAALTRQRRSSKRGRPPWCARRHGAWSPPCLGCLRGGGRVDRIFSPCSPRENPTQIAYKCAVGSGRRKHRRDAGARQLRPKHPARKPDETDVLSGTSHFKTRHQCDDTSPIDSRSLSPGQAVRRARHHRRLASPRQRLLQYFLGKR